MSDKKYKTHSAYRSMYLASKNKTKPTTNNNLLRWTLEKWINLTSRITDGVELDCGKKGKNQILLNLPSVCRPKYKISDMTPYPLADEISDEQIIKAIKIKLQNKRINWSSL